MKKTISGGGIVLNSKRQVVVVNQNGNSWSLPKGHVDPGETELEAAKREIYEETGILEKNLEFIKKLGSYQRYKISKGGQGEDESELKTIRMFLFKTKQKKLNPIDLKNPKALWVEINKVTELLTHKKDRKFFESVMGEIE